MISAENAPTEHAPLSGLDILARRAGEVVDDG